MAGRGSHVFRAALGTSQRPSGTLLSPPGMGVLTLNFTPVSPKRPCPLLPPGLGLWREPCPVHYCAWAPGCAPGPPLFLDFSGPPPNRPPRPEMRYSVSPPWYSVPVTCLSHTCHISVTCLSHTCYTHVTHLSSPWHLLLFTSASSSHRRCLLFAENIIQRLTF